MATEKSVIDRVRRLVADYTPPRLYDDEYYQDAIQFALEKLSFDWDASYNSVPDVPVKHTFLLVKLATIQMCYIRASEGAEGSGMEGDDNRYTDIAVPDLTVSDDGAEDSRGPAYWMKLADKLQAEYDGEIGSPAGQNTGGNIEVGVSRRISLTNGGYRKRVLDPGLDAVTVGDPPTVSGSDVTVEWTTLLTEGFLYYEVVRSPTAVFDDATEEVVQHEADIHVGEYTEEDVPVGTWYYMVRTVNPNMLKTDSNVVSAVVS